MAELLGSVGGLNPGLGQELQREQQNAWTNVQTQQAADIVKKLNEGALSDKPIFSPLGVAGNVAQALAGNFIQGQQAQQERQRLAAQGAGATAAQSILTGSDSPGVSPSITNDSNPGASSSAAPNLPGGASDADKIANISSMGETGRPFSAASLPLYSADTGGSTSYGPFGLNSHSGSAREFAQEHPELGLTAAPGTAEWNNQWRTAATQNPDAMMAAHRDWHQNHILNGITQPLIDAGIDPSVANDPRVVAYFADRKVQMGGVGLDRALSGAAGAQSAQDLLNRVGHADLAAIPENFHSYLSTHPNDVRGLANRITLRTVGAMNIGGGQGQPGTQVAGGAVPGAPGAMALQPPQGPQPGNPLAGSAPFNAGGAPGGIPAAQANLPPMAPQAPPIPRPRPTGLFGTDPRQLTVMGSPNARVAGGFSATPQAAAVPAPAGVVMRPPAMVGQSNPLSPTPMLNQGGIPTQGVPGANGGGATMPRPVPTVPVQGGAPNIPPAGFGGGSQGAPAPTPQVAAPASNEPIAQERTGPAPGTYIPGSMSPDRIRNAQILARSLISNPYTHEVGLNLLDKLQPQIKEFDNGTIGTGNDFIGYHVTGRQAVPKVTQTRVGIHGPFGAGVVEVPLTAPGSNVSVPGIDQLQKLIEDTFGKKKEPEITESNPYGDAITDFFKRLISPEANRGGIKE